MSILQVTNLTITAPHKTLCDKVSFGIDSGQKVALVARNGAGKSTLLRVLMGQQEPDDGRVEWMNGVSIGYLQQNDSFDPEMSVLDVLFLHDSEEGKLIKAYEQALHHEDHEQLEQIVKKIEELQAWDYETNVRIVIDKLQLHDLLDQKISQCSGGELKRIALAKLFIEDPDVFLLDEPTNHLDLEMIEWLEQYLKRSARALLIVTHDRYFLERVCDTILELDHGEIYSYPGNYQRYLELKMQREAVEAQQQHQMKQLMRKELERVKKAPRARGSKSVKRAKEARELKEAYHSRKKKNYVAGQQLDISLQDQRLGGKILKLQNIQKSFGEKCIVDQFTYDFRAGERVGLIGKNGVGKSTFINLLMDDEPVDSGAITRGITLTMAKYHQKQKPIDHTKRVIDVVKDVAEYITIGGGKRLSASQLLDQFLFPPSQQYQKARTLSGGEKRRLYLLTTLISNPNFLILDEPTNDLDVMTLAVLEDFLQGFNGCLVVVSHDRFFMDKVVDHLLVFEGDGIITEFPGSYSDRKEMEERKSEQPEEEMIEEKTPEVVIKKQSPKVNKSLSNKEREELARLESEIERLEERKDEINLRFGADDLAHEEIKVLGKELAELTEKLEGYEERWLELQE